MGWGYEIGQLRHRVTLQRPDANEGDAGGRSKGWADYATRWALVETRPSKEYFQGDQLTTRWDIKVVVRDIEPKATWRVKFGTRLMEVTSVRNTPDDRPIWSELFCKELLPS